MRPVAPRLSYAEERQFDGEVDKAITVGHYDDPAGYRWWVTRWRLSDDDLKQIQYAAGDVFVFVQSQHFPSLRVSVGSPEGT